MLVLLGPSVQVPRGLTHVSRICLATKVLNLMVACGGGHENIVRNIAQIDSGDRRLDRYWNIKNSPVMFCLKNNQIDMARCLIWTDFTVGRF